MMRKISVELGCRSLFFFWQRLSWTRAAEVSWYWFVKARVMQLHTVATLIVWVLLSDVWCESIPFDVICKFKYVTMNGLYLLYLSYRHIQVHRKMKVFHPRLFGIGGQSSRSSSIRRPSYRQKIKILEVLLKDSNFTSISTGIPILNGHEKIYLHYIVLGGFTPGSPRFSPTVQRNAREVEVLSARRLGSLILFLFSCSWVIILPDWFESNSHRMSLLDPWALWSIWLFHLQTPVSNLSCKMGNTKTKCKFPLLTFCASMLFLPSLLP